MRKIESSELHPILLNMGRIFHEICVRNNIKYWMLGGTQLGAVRHKGFIPWDDDMDFGIMDSDWQRLVEALDRELPQEYKCRTRFNYTGSFSNTLKIEDTRTVINPNPHSIDDIDNIGVNIDIFPMVHTNNDKSMFSRNWITARLITLQYWRFYDYSNRGFVSILSNLTKLLGFWLKKGMITDFVNKYTLPSKGSYIANFWGSWTLKEIIQKDIMGEPILQEFEDTSFYGVADTDKYLFQLYNNYMELPPEEKRHLHIHDMFWKELQ